MPARTAIGWLAALLLCGGAARAETGFPTPLATLAPGEVDLRYACDDKHALDACDPGSEAWRRWLATAPLAPSLERWLRIGGGGPLDAEWNPSHDVVVFASARDEPRAVRVGGRTIAAAEALPGGIVAFRVPLAVWRRAERRLRPGDGLPGVELGLRLVPMALVTRHGERPIAFLVAYGE